MGSEPSTYWVALTVSQNSTLIYNAGAGATLSSAEVEWTGQEEKIGRVGEPAVQFDPTLSPDGSRVTVNISSQKANNVDIWLEDVGGGGEFAFYI